MRTEGLSTNIDVSVMPTGRDTLHVTTHDTSKLTSVEEANGWDRHRTSKFNTTTRVLFPPPHVVDRMTVVTIQTSEVDESHKGRYFSGSPFPEASTKPRNTNQVKVTNTKRIILRLRVRGTKEGREKTHRGLTEVDSWFPKVQWN